MAVVEQWRLMIQTQSNTGNARCSDMGGYGSGRQNGKPLAEESKRVELDWMLQKGKLRPGSWGNGGRLSWTCQGEQVGWISYDYDMTDPADAWMLLRFTVRPYAGGEGKHHEQRVRLTTTQPTYGGRRWWMHCPLTGQRVRKLYCPINGDLFASRAAWGIVYRSQRSEHIQRPFDALFALQRRLGCPEGWGSYPRRPKGMWRRTFDRHLQRYWELDDVCGAIMMGKMNRIRERLGERKLA